MTLWYGADPAWRAAVEGGARRRFGADLGVEHRLDLAGRPGWSRRLSWLGGTRLTYTVADLEVDGRPALVDLTIRFWAEPGYPTLGQLPRDAPQVYAEPGLVSPHRHRDDGLCLWAPFDPTAMRWTSDRGLLDLIEIARRHLVLERCWRHSGGRHGGDWLLPDAPHGLPAA